ncbi:MAG: exodeoxyribonuclease VII large subunit [Puniceicoccales bacterium]|nr:exodeoxyribonuclease VII large subunit [Puniceicoccales bacterium]
MVGKSAATTAAVGGAAGKGAAVWSVGEFTRRLKTLIEVGLPFASVRGEISNLRRQSSGHVYFTLKDNTSQLAAVLFRGDALRTRCALRDGIQVVASGAVGVYEARGSYQLVVRQIEEDGAGRLRLAFEELKQKLAAEGLFAKELKRPLPPVARTIGVVTSPTGAALQDFLRILRRREWRGRVVVFPARVQGTEAAGEVAAALRVAGGLGIFDLLVVTRGGGSLEDLWPFNEEVVVRAVRAAGVPVVSAVGHEIDFTLCDFAADLRAETPSAAAELISSGFIEGVRNLARAGDALGWLATSRLETLGRRFRLAASALELRSPARLVESAWLRLDDLRNRLQAAPRLAAGVARRRLAEVSARLAARSPAARAALGAQWLAALADRLSRAARRSCERTADKLLALDQRLRASGVDATLRRGFALVLSADGAVLRSADAVRSGTALRLRFADGEALAEGKKRLT